MPDIQPLTDDVAQIKDILLGTHVQQIEDEQAAFVEVFETKISRDAEFAEQYKDLVHSRELRPSMKADLDNSLLTVCQQAKDAAKDIREMHSELQAYNEYKRNKKDTWEAKRQAYADEMRNKQQAFDASHRKELDKLDEKYAKLTRESIYVNLVGADSWRYQ
ncbi:hypothetical protein Unana1_02927 [Umbelopsis nana]